MKLFYTKRSPYARKIRIMALEKKIDLELIEEDLTKKSGGLIESNPLGKVPTLVIDKGKYLCDSPVICAYLDQIKPSPRFIPKDNDEKFQVLHVEAIADGLMDNTVGAYMEKVRHPENYDQNYINNQQVAVLRALDYFEQNVHLLKELNLASVAVASALGYLNFRLPQWSPNKVKHAHLIKWMEEFSKRPSIEQTKPAVS